MRICKKSKWTLPVFSLGLGAVVCAILTVAGRLDDGLWCLGTMVIFAAVFAFGGRSETIRGLRGDGRDERFHAMDTRATLVSGMVVMIAVVVASLVSVADGHNGAPYSWLGALFGLTYLASIAWLRIRG
ncbi:MAG: hypothetical protein WAU75_12450 [Solirubrobacteraceae bacterium]